MSDFLPPALRPGKEAQYYRSYSPLNVACEISNFIAGRAIRERGGRPVVHLALPIGLLTESSMRGMQVIAFLATMPRPPQLTCASRTEIELAGYA